MKHFKDFPKIEYSDNYLTNMLARAKVRKLILENASVYYDYYLDDYERPDILALKYYGTMDSTWILFYANEILDPQFDWLLNPEDFKAYILKKYNGVDLKDCSKYLGNIANVSTSGTVLTYTARFTPIKESDSIISPSGEIRSVISVNSLTQVVLDSPFNNNLSNVTCSVRNKYHSYYDINGLQIDFKTWKATAENERSQKTFYEYEMDLNERKRNIKVIDINYHNQIINEFATIFR